MSPTPERQHHNITLAVLAVGALSFALLQTMVAPALPAIQADLGVTTTQVSWVLTVYLLVASVATPIVGRLGDMFGKERMLVFTLGALALGTLVAALSHSIEMLVAGRAIQGIGGAIFPLAFGIIRDEFPREKVPTAIGLISVTFGIGGGLGLPLSGVIVDSLAYEWIFWLALPVIVAAIVATRLFVPESPVRAPARIDWLGALLMSAALTTLLLGISEGITGLSVAGVVLGALFLRVERRVRQPLIDLEVMRGRTVAATNLAAVLIGFGMFGSFILVPMLVQQPESTGFGFGADVTAAGLFLLPSSVVMLFAGPLAGRLSEARGSKLPLLIGTLAAAASYLMLAVAHDHVWEILLATSLMGAGISFSFAAMANLIVEAVPQTQTGVATGVNTIARTVGGALGAQISASVVASYALSETGFTVAFALSAVGVALAFLAALAIPAQRRLEPVPA